MDNLNSLEAHEICDPTRPPLSCFVRVCGRLLVHAAGATLWSHMLWRTPLGFVVGLCGVFAVVSVIRDRRNDCLAVGFLFNSTVTAFSLD